MNWHHRVLCGHLDRLVSGEIKRLMVCMPPRHGKSEVVSRRFPAYILGRKPDSQIIACSYGSDLASRMNRDVQRIMDGPSYQALFPGTRLSGENVKTAGHGKHLRNSDIFEVVGHKGCYRSAGVGGGITGMGCDFGLIDDPIKNREEADSLTYREKLWEWYCSTFLTRLEKGGAVLLVMCMVGETPVMMEDGSEKPLCEIRPGDRIATYDDGRISVTTVTNWANQGPDVVYEISMKSGITVKANARHPFLVQTDRGPEWRRTDSIQKGSTILAVTGASGRTSHAQRKDVASPPNARDSVLRTTISPGGRMDIDRLPSTLHHVAGRACATATGLIWKFTPAYSQNRTGFAPSVSSLLEPIHARTGAESSASTIVTRAEKPGGFSVTTAISPSATEKLSTSCLPPLTTYEITEDIVLDVVEAGVENVFDIEVDRTENFIAGGLVSHNTRWHEDDLAGRLLRLAETDPSADQWTVVRFPAEAEDGGEDDPRRHGEALWPNKYDTAALAKIKAGIGSYQWAGLYQQRPAPAAGGIFKTRWWRFWFRPDDPLPPVNVRLDNGELITCPVVALPKQFDEESQSWDMTFKGLEASKGGSPDFVVGQAWGRHGADCYLQGQTRGQWDLVETIDKVLSFSTTWPRALTKLIEDKANGPAVISTLRHKLGGLIAVEPNGDKTSRARAATPIIESGNVYLPHPSLAPWVWDFIHECAKFPGGRNDDQVDAMTQQLLRWTSSPIDVKAYTTPLGGPSIASKIKATYGSF